MEKRQPLNSVIKSIQLFSRTLILRIFYIISNWILTILAKSVFKTLNKHEIHYWADFGTLLGIIRDGGIIYKDTDVDLSVIESEETLNKLNLCCLETHLLFTLSKDKNRRSYEAKFRFIPARADIYVYRRDGAKRLYMGCEGPFSDLPEDLVMNFQIIIWKGIEVRIPSKTAQFLEYRYGSDWKIKKEKFHGRLHSTYFPVTEQEHHLRDTNIQW